DLRRAPARRRARDQAVAYRGPSARPRREGGAAAALGRTRLRPRQDRRAVGAALARRDPRLPKKGRNTVRWLCRVWFMGGGASDAQDWRAPDRHCPKLTGVSKRAGRKGECARSAQKALSPPPPAPVNLSGFPRARL